MAQRQFRSDDTDKWMYGFGDGSEGNGSINTSTDAPIDSACSGTATQTSLTATNVSFAAGQLILIHQTRGTGVGAWELNKIQSYTAGTITLTHALMNTYTNSGASCAQVIVMKQYNDLTINNAQTLTAKAWNGTVGGIIAYFVKGTLTVTGNINATGNAASGGTIGSGKGYLGGIRNVGDGLAGNQGEGTAGASAKSTAANGNGGGGGGYSNWQGGGGGGGGNGAAGSDSATYPGYGGAQVGAAALTTMDFGGGGGGASGGVNNTGNEGGAGGGGGGIVLIIAKTIAEITGTITLNGGNGGNATGTYGGGGGGGAGGSCLLKCQTAVLGTTKITSTAGSGGKKGADAGAKNGAAGAVGRIHLDYKTSYSGTTTPAIDVTQDATLDYPQAGWIPFFI